MKIPISWLKEFIDTKGLTIEEIARKLTLAGLEVEEIRYVGLPMPESTGRDTHSNRKHEFKTSGLSWDRDRIVVGEIHSVNPHPNADRLVLCDLYDGRQKHIVLTGAPNLFEYKGKGVLSKPIKVAYAREGATLFDGHAPGSQLMTLKRAKIRGVESYSMACSEKELGISDEHEGIILLEADAPVGMPLADYMGDAVLDLVIEPNMARNANVLGVARELAALTGRKSKKPVIQYQTSGKEIKSLVSIEIHNPELNPRFVLGLIRDVEIKPSPYQVQLRLKLAGMRPINCIVDATNYAMLEIGQPLHAFDYDVLQDRAGSTSSKVSKQVRINTRTAKKGEKLTTLDGVQRNLSESNVLVCDEKGALSIAGIMGGVESEVYEASDDVPEAVSPEQAPEPNADKDGSKNKKSPHGKASVRSTNTSHVLLEGAAWNFINIRRTAGEHNLPSEASFRFSRGVHPALAELGVKRGLQLMAKWSGGRIAPGLVDKYPLKSKNPTITLTHDDVKRLLGIDIKIKEVARLLERLEFQCVITKSGLRVTAPPHRMDIGEGVVGLADVLEEVARIYGYDRIPETRMADELPAQVGNPVFEWQEHLRDILASLGFQEVIGYRLTSPEREGRLLGTSPQEIGEYARISNPTTPERRVLRKSLLASVLDTLENNIRLRESLALFEIGPVFTPDGNNPPNENGRLAIAMTGARQPAAWDAQESPWFDFYDLKGRIERILSALKINEPSYMPADNPPHLHPGKAAEIKLKEKVLGIFGELHPLVKARYDFTESPVLVCEFDLEMLRSIQLEYGITPVPDYPAVYEDIALILDESIPAARVEDLMRKMSGGVVTNIRLFDVYRGEQVGAGKKSLAYNLTYQASDRTLTDVEVATIRNGIVQHLAQEIGAKLRS